MGEGHDGKKVSINSPKKRKWGGGGQAGTGVLDGVSRGIGMSRVHAIVYLVMGKDDCIKKASINSAKKAKMGVGGSWRGRRLALGIQGCFGM